MEVVPGAVPDFTDVVPATGGVPSTGNSDDDRWAPPGELWLCSEQSKTGTCYQFGSAINQTVNWVGPGIRSIGQWPRADCYYYTEKNTKGQAMMIDTIDNIDGGYYPVLPPSHDGKIQSWICFDRRRGPPAKRGITAVSVVDLPVTTISASANSGADEAASNGTVLTFFSGKNFQGQGVTFPYIADDKGCWNLGDFSQGSLQQASGHLCKYYYGPGCTVTLFPVDTIGNTPGTAGGTGDLAGFTNHVKSVSCSNQKWKARSTDLALAPSEAAELPLAAIGDTNDDTAFFWLYPQKNYQGTAVYVIGAHDDGACLNIGSPAIASLAQLAGHFCTYFTGKQCDGQGAVIDTRDLKLPAGRGFPDMAGLLNNVHSFSCAKVS
ncbi:hypothetical protein K491DRAFT_694713 [Lophiostoma macrostomum CBS 122681]|uniref:Uncharacterized protein n=1 Tax=Lophiostoma macrostomum CBS 122681 TaxID=1314788 RepID=A0A6A6T130_9PLEO|nr:hypothetical protein K491DRAFT_694713 [Lophiostoma macrostomum CBS 122681]